ncbi:MAG: hypothetical protein FJ276_34400 [Planctomycetes bacterium]|nr:hypothetical protein [Planctomycetota bacterium]
MKQLAIVHSDTWHLCLDQLGPPRDHIVPDVELLGSPYRCDFSGLRLPLIDWRVPAIGTVPVRVVVHDDLAFFPLLAAADRDFILRLFAHMIVHMIKGY